MGLSRRRIAHFSGIVLGLVLCVPLALSAADDEFEQFQAQSDAAFQRFVSEEEQAYAQYQKEIEQQWQSFVGSTKKDWVDYSQDKSTRSIVDFEKGTVTVETVIEIDPKKKPQHKSKKSLNQLAWQKIEQHLRKILQDKSVSGKSPIAGQLQLKDGKKLNSQNLQTFSDQSLKKKVKVASKPYVAKDGKKRIKAKVIVKMMPDHLKVRAEKFRKPVETYSGKFDVERSLVMAVIHTESYFNPKARSGIPAYGLMQLVPKSGGRDAYKRAYGKDKIPSSRFLYDPNNNIELGAAYLTLLSEREFRGVKDPLSKKYLIVSAYNTGAGNVSRALIGKKNVRQSIKKINSMSPDELFLLLKKKLPYKETRDYLQRVVKRQALYQGF